MRQATKLADHYKVIAQYLFEGHWNITVEIEGDGWKMPKVLSFDGKVFGFTGWNSDRDHAYYNTGTPLATDLTEEIEALRAFKFLSTSKVI